MEVRARARHEARATAVGIHIVGQLTRWSSRPLGSPPASPSLVPFLGAPTETFCAPGTSTDLGASGQRLSDWPRPTAADRSASWTDSRAKRASQRPLPALILLPHRWPRPRLHRDSRLPRQTVVQAARLSSPPLSPVTLFPACSPTPV